jgi:hypothetical protein
MYLLEYDFHNKENKENKLLVLRRTLHYIQRMYIYKGQLFSLYSFLKAHPKVSDPPYI